MPQTLVYDFPLPETDQWVDQSIYTFALEDEAENGFAPTMTFVRKRLKDPNLQGFALEHRKTIQSDVPNLKLVHEGHLEVGGMPAYEAQYTFQAAPPIGGMQQWHVLFIRGEYGYTCCCTTLQRRFDADKARFEGVLRSIA